MKKFFVVAGAVVVLAILSVLLLRTELQRASFALTLFSGEEQYENFNRVAELFPTSVMSPAPAPYDFPLGTKVALPGSFDYGGRDVNVETFLVETDTSALLVLHNGELVYERYLLTGGRDVNWLSMSVAKSFVSAGIGIASDQGLLDVEQRFAEIDPLIGARLFLEHVNLTFEGAYALAAFSGAPGPLVEGVPWGTDAVMKTTLKQAATFGRHVGLMDPWYDVDTGADLEVLRRDLQSSESGGYPALRRFFQELETRS